MVAQIASAFALLTWPALVYLTLLGIAVWAYRRRLRQLAVSLGADRVLAWGSAFVLRQVLIGRDRPAPALELLTSTGYAYPAGHMVAATAFCIGVGADLQRHPTVGPGPYALAGGQLRDRRRGRGGQLDPRRALDQRHRRWRRCGRLAA